MGNVIKFDRKVVVSVLECGDLLANEYSPYGLNKPNETFEQYCERMDYHEAKIEPRWPMPAIIYEAVFPWEDAGYMGMIYVNDLSVEDDPYLVACWDWFFGPNDPWYGKYQACYTDGESSFYKEHGAWNGPVPTPPEPLEDTSADWAGVYGMDA